MQYLLRNSRYFFTIEETKSFIRKSISNYFGLEDSDFLENFELPRIEVSPGVLEIRPVSLDVYYRKSHSRDKFKNLHYNLTLDDLGPFEFEKAEFKEFLSSVTHLQLKYRIDSAIPTKSVGNFD